MAGIITYISFSASVVVYLVNLFAVNGVTPVFS